MKTQITIMSLIVNLLFTYLASAQSQNYGSISFNKAINISGKQRMLSQKMSKSYLLIAKGIRNKDIERELSSGKFIFEKQLDILSQNASGSLIKLSIKNVRKTWNEFKGIINSTPNITGSADILRLNTKLLKACHELVLSIEASSNYSNQFFKNKSQDLVNTINISGKQRMLSQRLCLYYTASTIFPSKRKENNDIMNPIFEEFDGVIGNLLICSYNNTEVEEELGIVMSIWEKFQRNKRAFLNGDFTLEEVYKTTNELTKSFNKITGIYEIIAKNS